jgi:RNA-directed DNA polymerase
MSNALEKFERSEWTPKDIPSLVSKNVTLTWHELPWKRIERRVFKLQKRIYRASLKGNLKLVRKLQKTLVHSWFAKLLAVRKVTQENKGKNTAGVDGIKSLTPKQRLELVDTLRLDGKSSPTRRVWIPKPGKKEKRPLGIPTVADRAKQALLKMAIEPEWEARFEPNSYGFRPARACHDAAEAIFSSINKKPKYVLDADISQCFDRIDHKALLEKLNTFPTFKRQIKSWLKSGVIDFSEYADRKGYNETREGTPQGGVISPLLANVALHGLENLLKDYIVTIKMKNTKGRVIRTAEKLSNLGIIRYADDFVVLHENLEVVIKCKELIEAWLKDIGLELKPSKTRIAHTLNEYEGEEPGFNFLGFNIRQYSVGKTHSGKDTKRRLLGFKTIISPSKESIQRHYDNLVRTIDKHKAMAQAVLIGKLNPIIRGWCNYHTPFCSREAFSKLNYLLWKKLWKWANSRHPNKGKKWSAKKYWQTVGGDKWIFTTPKNSKNPATLVKHTDTSAGVGWVKVQA